MYKQMTRGLIKAWITTGIKTGYAYWFIDRFPHLYVGQAPVIAQLRHNLKMECLLGDHVQSRIYFFGAYEPIEVHLLSTLLDSDSVFLDVGANVGFYSLMLSQSVPKGKVYAFEPVETNYRVLEKNIRANNLESKIRLIKKGLWYSNTTLKFSLPDEEKNNLGSFTAGKSTFKKNQVSCEVITLDSFVESEKLSRLDVIKMDIEGAELFALRGGEQTLAKYQPIIQIELNRRACEGFEYSLKDLEVLLKKYNYSFYQIGHTAEKSQFIETFDGVEQVNVLALPGNKREKLNTHWKSREIVQSFVNQ